MKVASPTAERAELCRRLKIAVKSRPNAHLARDLKATYLSIFIRNEDKQVGEEELRGRSNRWNTYESFTVDTRKKLYLCVIVNSKSGTVCEVKVSIEKLLADFGDAVDMISLPLLARKNKGRKPGSTVTIKYKFSRIHDPQPAAPLPQPADPPQPAAPLPQPAAPLQHPPQPAAPLPQPAAPPPQPADPPQPAAPPPQPAAPPQPADPPPQPAAPPQPADPPQPAVPPQPAAPPPQPADPPQPAAPPPQPAHGNTVAQIIRAAVAGAASAVVTFLCELIRDAV